MTPPQITRCSTSNEEVMSDSEASMASDEASSISTLPSVPGTMSPLPSGRRKNRSRCKTRGPKTPRVQVSNVKNSPNMVVVVGNGTDSLGQSNSRETEYLKNPIVEDEAQETGIDSTERSGNAVRDCPNCEVFRNEIQDKNAKLEKIKAKNCKLTSEKDELNEKLQSIEANLQLLTQQNNEFKCKLITAGCNVAEQFAVCKNAMQERINDLEISKLQLEEEFAVCKNAMQERINDLEISKLHLEEEKRSREEKLSLEKEQLVEKMGQESAIAMEQFAANFAVHENAMQERISDLEDYAFALEEELRASKERDELSVKANDALKTESEKLNSTVDGAKEGGKELEDPLASSRRRAKNQRKRNDALIKENDELEDKNTTLLEQLNDAKTRLNETTTRLNETTTRLNETTTRLNETTTRLNETTARLNETTAQVATERRRSSDLCISNTQLRNLVSSRREAFGEFVQRLDNLRNHRQPVDQIPNEQIINDVQFPQLPGQFDITVLRCEIVTDVHVPD